MKKEETPLSTSRRGKNAGRSRDLWVPEHRVLTHPGEALREDFLPDYGLTVSNFAKAIGVSRRTATELLDEKLAVDTEMASRLSRFFHSSAEFWLSMQRAYDASKLLQSKLFRHVGSIKVGHGSVVDDVKHARHLRGRLPSLTFNEKLLRIYVDKFPDLDLGFEPCTCPWAWSPAKGQVRGNAKCGCGQHNIDQALNRAAVHWLGAHWRLTCAFSYANEILRRLCAQFQALTPVLQSGKQALRRITRRLDDTSLSIKEAKANKVLKEEENKKSKRSIFDRIEGHPDLIVGRPKDLTRVRFKPVAPKKKKTLRSTK
jgi:addiction module HigA family antidote